MTTQPKIRWIADGGHAWLEVPLDTCDGLDISTYSYQHRDKAYLECDCDAAVWWAAHGGQANEPIPAPVTHVEGDWEGRENYLRYRPKVRA